MTPDERNAYIDSLRRPYYPIDHSDGLDHAAQLADEKVNACEWQAFVDRVDATDCSSQWADIGADHD